MLAASCSGRDWLSRLSRIRQRGYLVCGVFPGIALGFAQVDRNGRYSGFDIDVCRAVAAAVAGSADRIRMNLSPHSIAWSSRARSISCRAG
jgi:general L-amino acid transport system substrate-binding protein